MSWLHRRPAWTVAASLYAAWLGLARPAPGQAQAADVPAERVRVSSDTVLRYVPRYELSLDPQLPAGRDQYWRRVDQAVTYERVTLDARHLHDDSLDVHIQAWGAADLAADEDAQLASGDFAVAYARYRLLQPLAVWGGRRFLSWGVPGGLHIDGAGLEQRSESGFSVDAIAGRPVATVYTTLGPHSDFTVPTGAAGIRVGFDRPGQVSLGLSYLERWAEGLAADRALMVSAIGRPHERIDMQGSATLDVRSGLQELQARIRYLASDAIEPDVSFMFMDPQKLLPDWSLFSVFATQAYGELGVGSTFRPLRSLSTRLEVGLRRAKVPGEAADTADFGHRVQLNTRVRPVGSDQDYLFEIGRRDMAGTRLTLGRIGASFVAFRRLRLAPQVGLAVDEQHSERTALLLRGSAELPVAAHWDTAFTFDYARTPVALGEVRALLRVSYRFDTEGT